MYFYVHFLEVICVTIYIWKRRAFNAGGCVLIRIGMIRMWLNL